MTEWCQLDPALAVREKNLRDIAISHQMNRPTASSQWPWSGSAGEKRGGHAGAINRTVDTRRHVDGGWPVRSMVIMTAIFVKKRSAFSPACRPPPIQSRPFKPSTERARSHHT